MRIPLRILCLGALSAGTSASAQANPTPIVVRSRHTATVPVIAAVKSFPVQPRAGDASACAAEACVDQTVQVHANTTWHLQVRLDPAASLAVDRVDTRGASLVEHLEPGVFQTVASGTATFESEVVLSFRVAHDGSIATPDGELLGTLLSYRVVAAP